MPGRCTTDHVLGQKTKIGAAWPGPHPPAVTRTEAPAKDPASSYEAKAVRSWLEYVLLASGTLFAIVDPSSGAAPCQQWLSGKTEALDGDSHHNARLGSPTIGW